MVAYFLIFFAAIFNAAMDRIENDVAFNRSIFNHLDKRFWLKSVSWEYADKIFGWKADGWHICKSAMIILLISAIFFANGLQWWHFPILGIVWNATFNLFYNRIMKR